MKSPNILLMPCFLLVLLLSIVCIASAKPHQHFIQCLTHHSHNSSISQLIYTPNNSSYTSILLAYIQYLKNSFPLPNPVAIVTPFDESQIRAIIYCSKKHGLHIRVRSGGHDFEGLSYRSEVPFVIIDLFNFRSISVDVKSRTAWVQSGANLGELHYAIAQKSNNTLGFPGATWPTVGVGGYISGGGYSPLMRKYGFAADNVVDAKFMDVSGRILNRETMDKDLFWAIRGGGGGNFGIILAWKLYLVTAPEIVSLCTVLRTLETNATKLVHKWQQIAHDMPKDLLFKVHLYSWHLSIVDPKRTIVASFELVYLGKVIDGLLPLVNKRFPELGLAKEDCHEMSWIEAVMQLDRHYPIGTPPEVLLNRTAPGKAYAKIKSDYVEEPISEEALLGLWDMFYQTDLGNAEMIWTPYGGRMSEISESETPYPHRGGILFMIYQAVYWDGRKVGVTSPTHLKWIRDLYNYMAPYVSKNPRSSYVNHRDLDLGVNDITGRISYEEARVWGEKYFKKNFKKLAMVKRAVDPKNFFRNEQSIPPL